MGLGGRTAGLSDALLYSWYCAPLCCLSRCCLSTNDLVYGSHEVWVGTEPLPVLELPLGVAEGRGGGGAGPDQTCVAAFAAAGCGRFRKVVVIFPDACLPFPSARNVFNIPPLFFSGLGVRVRALSPIGGVRLGDGDFLGCEVSRVTLSRELFLLIKDGRGGGTGLFSGAGVGRGISEYCA